MAPTIIKWVLNPLRFVITQLPTFTRNVLIIFIGPHNSTLIAGRGPPCILVLGRGSGIFAVVELCFNLAATWTPTETNNWLITFPLKKKLVDLNPRLLFTETGGQLTLVYGHFHYPEGGQLSKFEGPRVSIIINKIVTPKRSCWILWIDPTRLTPIFYMKHWGFTGLIYHFSRIY